MIPAWIKADLEQYGHAVHENSFFEWNADERGEESVYTCPCCGMTIRYHQYRNGNTRISREERNCTTSPEFRKVLNTLPDLFWEVYQKGVTNGKNMLEPYQAQCIDQLTLLMSYIIRDMVSPEWTDIRMKGG